MQLIFDDATDEDAAALTALHAAAAADLVARFGDGPWRSGTIVRATDAVPGRVRLRVARRNGEVVAGLRLQTKKPWAIDAAYFTAVPRALYLTGMVVAVGAQRQGVGRAALDDAFDVARRWPAQAIRLDAFDADAGAGPFYARCGYAERGRVTYRSVPLIYFERLTA
jgi:GNAT superfamily N-acetyltransferase